jgi:predicted unusual protein kinase regulating ubiquinone biosynthesis (AarF/ABC1/UbiB family)
LGPNLKASHLKRYAEIARLFWKYGRADLLRRSPLERALGGDLKNEAPPAQVCELASDLEAMGPTFVKLGQALSTRSDLLPPQYRDALARLQNQVAAVPFDQISDILREELEKPLARAFEWFNVEPLAAASLGQVHYARLPDKREVVVKVQRPSAREQVLEDLAILGEVAGFLEAHTDLGSRYGLATLVEELGRTIVKELDYRQEAQNLMTMATNLREFERIVVPIPVAEYTTERILTMDFIEGRKLSALSVARRPEVDGCTLADELFRAYLKQVLVDGFFHADPHPGNVFLTEDGKLALLDLGMVARLTPALREDLMKWVLAASDGRAEEAVDVAIKIGFKLPDRFDEAAFRERLGTLITHRCGMRAERAEFGGLVLDAAETAASSGVRMPREFMMLGKTLLNLQHVSDMLDKAFDPNEAIRRHAAEITQRQLWRNLSPGHLLSTLVEVKTLAEEMPRRANRILETLAANDLRLKVDAIDEKNLLGGLQKIANRITLGLVLAALIIAGAMLMRVETRFTLLGYPGFSMLLFLAAAAGGIALALSIVMSDVKARKRKS